MRNTKCFCFKVPEEAVNYTKQLVGYSLDHHTVPNAYDGAAPDTYGLNGVERSQEYRFVGTLGEVLFADVYGLPRPKRSFGANDGQDNGKDFQVLVDGELRNIDVKTMHRTGHVLYNDYVLNITARQLLKENSLTDFYFHITLSYDKKAEKKDIIAYFIGHISKTDVQKYGEFFPEGSLRTNKNGTTFPFHEDTYEIMLGDFETVPEPIPEVVNNLPGFKYITLKETQGYSERRKRLDEESR